MIWLSDISNREFVRLTAYSDSSERTVIILNPVKMSDEPDWNPQWEEWNCYNAPLLIPLSDFERLLRKYFDIIYPTVDAFDGTTETCFDVCSYNWIGEEDWRIVISAIRADMRSFSGVEQRFFGDFLDWLDKSLKNTRIIVAEGNL